MHLWCPSLPARRCLCGFDACWPVSSDVATASCQVTSKVGQTPCGALVHPLLGLNSLYGRACDACSPCSIKHINRTATVCYVSKYVYELVCYLVLELAVLSVTCILRVSGSDIPCHVACSVDL